MGKRAQARRKTLTMIVLRIKIPPLIHRMIYRPNGRPDPNNHQPEGFHMKVTARHPESDRVVEVEWDCPTLLADLVKKWGEEVVANNAISSMRVSVQGIMRTAMSGETPKTDKDIQTIVSKYKPGLRVRGKTPQEKIAEQFAKMSEQDKRAIIQRLSKA
jgi:hypothetical protein